MGILDISKILVGNFKLTNLFKNSYLNLLEIRKQINNEFSSLSYSEDIKIELEKLNFVKGFRKNFFTLLMISVLEKSDISKEKIVEYGKILFCIRAIITCTDNIIDNEEKGVIFLEGIENPIVNNTLLLMTNQNLLTRTLIKLGDDTHKTFDKILENIHVVAKSEGLRSRELYKEYPEKERIINEIHNGIGGALLQLSLAAPISLENNREKLMKFSEGLYDIGMALQALDDLCDIQEDYESGKINLGVSYFINEANISEEKLGNEIKKGDLENRYSKMYGKYVDCCIKDSLKGFSKFESVGYPVKEKDAVALMKILFELRGLAHMWELTSYGKSGGRD